MHGEPVEIDGIRFGLDVEQHPDQWIAFLEFDADEHLKAGCAKCRGSIQGGLYFAAPDKGSAIAGVKKLALAHVNGLVVSA